MKSDNTSALKVASPINAEARVVVEIHDHRGVESDGVWAVTWLPFPDGLAVHTRSRAAVVYVILQDFFACFVPCHAPFPCAITIIWLLLPKIKIPQKLMCQKKKKKKLQGVEKSFKKTPRKLEPYLLSVIQESTAKQWLKWYLNLSKEVPKGNPSNELSKMKMSMIWHSDMTPRSL